VPGEVAGVAGHELAQAFRKPPGDHDRKPGDHDRDEGDDAVEVEPDRQRNGEYQAKEGRQPVAAFGVVGLEPSCIDL
jgi:hypothetical protein